ncbi:hypothetical protein ScPMuIL_008406 [Solemya velum]
MDVESISETSPKTLQSYEKFYQPNKDFVREINSVQKSWTAAVYPEHGKMTIKQLLYRSGGPKTISFPKTATVQEETRKLAQILPVAFDWRNFNGQNYVSRQYVTRRTVGVAMPSLPWRWRRRGKYGQDCGIIEEKCSLTRQRHACQKTSLPQLIPKKLIIGGYTGGIQHTGLTDKFNPWEITNTVVRCCGYGQDNSTAEPFGL